MAVKMKAESQAGSLDPGTYSKFWLLYFILTIGVIGLIGAYVMSVPIYFLGRVADKLSPRIGARLTASADRVMCSGIYFLMFVQPWFNADIRIHLNSRDPKRMANLATFPNECGRLLVSNHRSHLDAFILLSRVEGIRIFAKRSLFYIPFLGMMMRMSRQIPVSREINAFFQAMNDVRERLRNGSTVHIFPEMTRCGPGQIGTRNFSAMPFLIAIQEKVPVIPIVFKATDDVWPKNHFGLAFRKSTQAWALEPIDPAQFQSAEELRSEVRRRINEALESGPR